jgi:hypothetical protein
MSDEGPGVALPAGVHGGPCTIGLAEIKAITVDVELQDGSVHRRMFTPLDLPALFATPTHEALARRQLAVIVT